jgi:hypothetical protein
MTYCNTLFEPLIEKIEIEMKTLDEIAGEVCGDTVKNPRQKIIRIIKVILGEEYLIEHAQTLGYNTVKAVRQKSTTDEVVNRKILTEEVEESDNSGESESVTPIASCTTKVLAVNTEQGEAGQTKGQEQVIEEHDKPAACCQGSSKTVRKKKDSEKETTGQVSIENKFDVLVGEIKRLIEKYSLEEVKKALVVAESDI